MRYSGGIERMRKLIYWFLKSMNGNRRKCRYFCPTCEYSRQCRKDGGMV